MPETIIEALANLGPAGVIGLLWVWERTTSRRREAQLDEAHRSLRERQEQLDSLMELVRGNTVAMTRIEQTHEHLCRIMERWLDRDHTQHRNHSGNA